MKVPEGGSRAGRLDPTRVAAYQLAANHPRGCAGEAHRHGRAADRGAAATVRDPPPAHPIPAPDIARPHYPLSPAIPRRLRPSASSVLDDASAAGGTSAPLADLDYDVPNASTERRRRAWPTVRVSAWRYSSGRLLPGACPPAALGASQIDLASATHVGTAPASGTARCPVSGRSLRSLVTTSTSSHPPSAPARFSVRSTSLVHSGCSTSKLRPRRRFGQVSMTGSAPAMTTACRRRGRVLCTVARRRSTVSSTGAETLVGEGPTSCSTSIAALTPFGQLIGLCQWTRRNSTHCVPSSST